jgi:hypothetical protein
MTREPTAVLGALGVFLASLAKLAVLMGWVDWSAEQLAGLTLVIDSALITLGTLFIRSQVTPTASPRLEVGQSVNHGHAVVAEVNSMEV